jgi:hypothetical protein
MATPETSEGSTLPPTEQTTTEEEKPRPEPLDCYWCFYITCIDYCNSRSCSWCYC